MRRICLLIFLLVFSCQGFSQSSSQTRPEAGGAFLRSLAFPGWGHHYVDSSDWQRGQYHAGAEVLLILSYLGLDIHSNNLKQNWFSYTRAEAGIDVDGKSRRIRLAVGDFNSLEAYNDFQLRARNWDLLIADLPENRWKWKGDADRAEYNSLRNRFDRIDQQLPAIIGLMVINRVVSALSAYNRAKKRGEELRTTAFYLAPDIAAHSISANVKISF